MKNPVVTCDSCKKLKLKCGWDRSPSFQPACARCQTYGLPCVFGGSAWTAAAVKEVVASFPGAPSRRLFWGAASNAGGHPLDLHREAPPPPPQPHTQQAGFARPLSPGPGPRTSVSRPATGVAGRSRLLINSNMRAHLYDVFFAHIQPVVPVVTRQSLVEGGTVPTLLDAAILGLAARHHLSISSTRDFLHIRDVILDELKETLCNFRRRYAPQTQTVQALLILLLQLELCTRTHDDLPSISLRVALACRMAQDLGLHRSFDDDTHRQSVDNDLPQNIWAMCVYVDTVHSAAFGQTAHIAASVTQGLAENLYRRATTLLETADATQEGVERQEMMARARFLHLVGLLCGLRQILRCFFGVNPTRTTSLRDQATATLHTVSDLHAHSEDLMRTHPDAYDAEARQLFPLLAANNRVIYSVGLRSVLPGDDPLVLSSTSSLVDDACQIVEWTTPAVLRATMGQMMIVLYATSRSLMVVVDALRGARRDTTAFPAEQVARLEACTVHAATLMEFLLRSGSWSAFWTQGHTIQAILARLEQDDGGSGGPLLPQAAVGDNPMAYAVADHPPPVPTGYGFPMGQTGSAGIIYAGMPMMDPATLPVVDNTMANMGNNGNMFPSTNWDDFFFNYVQEYGWLAEPGFAGDNNDGDMYADYVFEDNNV